MPIIETLKVLHGDKSFQHMLRNMFGTRDSKIRDIKDGAHYLDSLYFKTHPEADGIMLFSDAVELRKPSYEK